MPGDQSIPFTATLGDLVKMDPDSLADQRCAAGSMDVAWLRHFPSKAAGVCLAYNSGILRNIASLTDKEMALPMLRRALLAVCIVTTLAAAARGEVVFEGVAAGDPSSTDAIVWTRADSGGSTTSLTAQVATDQGFANIVATLGGTTGSDSDFTLKLLASGLAANTRYYYRFLAPSGGVSPTGQFVTAPAPNQRAAVKFGFSGDADGHFRPYPSIANLPGQKLALFLFPGDAMYETASTGSPAVPLIIGETTDPGQLEEGLKAYDRKYMENMLGVDPASGHPIASGQQSLQPMLAATRQPIRCSTTTSSATGRCIGRRAAERPARDHRPGVRRQHNRQLRQQDAGVSHGGKGVSRLPSDAQLDIRRSRQGLH
jgi:hypothetical protein